MGFGLKAFKDQKKQQQAQKSSSHYRHVIVGDSLSAICSWLNLINAFPEEKILLLSERLINIESLKETYERGISLWRNSADIQKWSDLIPQWMGDWHTHAPQFYKEGKFHDFGGRAKGMELLAHESFFTSSAFEPAFKEIFQMGAFATLSESLKNKSEVRIINKLLKTQSSDLVDKAEWTIECKDFHTITAEFLYLGASAHHVKQWTKNSLMSDDFNKWLSSQTQMNALQVSFDLNTNLNLATGTYFFPQSMTHEWGHFIAEVPLYSAGRLNVLMLIHEEEPQAEDLASKIKLMKRVIERAIPKFDQMITKEHIVFRAPLFTSKISADVREQISFDYPTLTIIEESFELDSLPMQEEMVSL